MQQTPGHVRPLGFISLSQCLGNIAATAEQQVVSALDICPFLGGETATAQTYDVQACQLITPMRHAIRRHIPANHGIALDNRILADVDKLMKATSSAKEYMVSHLDMSGEQYIVSEHIFSTHLHIMGKVHTCHQKVGVSDPGAAAIRRAAVNGNILTDTVIITNSHIAIGLWFEGRILGVSSDNRAVTNMVSRSHLRLPGDPGMSTNDTAGTYLDAGINDGEGPHTYVFS